MCKLPVHPQVTGEADLSTTTNLPTSVPSSVNPFTLAFVPDAGPSIRVTQQSSYDNLAGAPGDAVERPAGDAAADLWQGIDEFDDLASSYRGSWAQAEAQSEAPRRSGPTPIAENDLGRNIEPFSTNTTPPLRKSHKRPLGASKWMRWLNIQLGLRSRRKQDSRTSTSGKSTIATFADPPIASTSSTRDAAPGVLRLRVHPPDTRTVEHGDTWARYEPSQSASALRATQRGPAPSDEDDLVASHGGHADPVASLGGDADCASRESVSRPALPRRALTTTGNVRVTFPRDASGSSRGHGDPPGLSSRFSDWTPTPDASGSSGSHPSAQRATSGLASTSPTTGAAEEVRRGAFASTVSFDLGLLQLPSGLAGESAAVAVRRASIG